MKKSLGMFLALCMILSLAIGTTTAFAADDGYVTGNSGTFAVEDAVDRVRAYQECQNLAGAHEFYHTALDHQGELDNCWVTEEPYLDTMSWTNNTQFMYGYDNVWEFYCGTALTGHGQSTQAQAMAVDTTGQITMDDEWYAAGTLWYHMLMSPVIEVAKDGQTAIGLWQSFGTVTEVSMCQWTCEDYTMVFVKQSDGEWRIWHLRTFVHFYTTYGYNWYQQNMATQGAVGNQPAGVGVLANDGAGGASDPMMPPNGDMTPPGGASGGPSGGPDMPTPGQEDYSINGTYYVGLDLYKVPVLATIPQPYDTWADIEDTFAWGGFQPLLGKNAEH